jgi:hypothetical protein
MHFNTITLILVSALATGLLASPFQDEGAVTGWVEQHSEAGKSGGTLHYFGPAGNTEILPSQEERTDLQARAVPG